MTVAGSARTIQIEGIVLAAENQLSAPWVQYAYYRTVNMGMLWWLFRWLTGMLKIGRCRCKVRHS